MPFAYARGNLPENTQESGLEERGTSICGARSARVAPYLVQNIYLTYFDIFLIGGVDRALFGDAACCDSRRAPTKGTVICSLRSVPEQWHERALRK